MSVTCEWRCLPCRAIPHVNWDEWIGPGEHDLLDHHEDVAALNEAARLGCRLCRILWWSLFQFSENKALFDAHDLPVGRCTLRVMMLPLGYDGSEGRNDMSIKFMVGRTVRTVFIKERTGEAVGESSWDLRGLTLDGDGNVDMPSVRLFQPGTRDRDMGTLVDDIIEPWVTTCLDNHPLCRSYNTDQGDSSILPTRLIDVSDENTLFLRNTTTDLPSDDTGSPPYLILSYCWGGSTQGRTTWHNVHQRQKEGFHRDEFAQTLKDAFALTRRMGMRYLWIDAVCIVQPVQSEEGESLKSQTGIDEGDPSDWKREAPRMKDYYSNARCTVAASRARKGDHGFLSERLGWRFGYPRPCVIGSRNSQGGEQRHLLVYGETYTWEDEFSKQPLMMRGWCYQEWLLSRRMLHFSRTGTYWECRSIRGASEADPWQSKATTYDLVNDLRTANETGSQPMRLQVVRSILDADVAEGEIPYLWATVLHTYCRMSLTHGSDKLVAIRGVVERLLGERPSVKDRQGRGKGAEYAAGVFRTGLAGLMWKSPGVARETMLNDVPSWSWASIPAVSFLQVQALVTRPTLNGYMHSLAEAVSFPGTEGEGISTSDPETVSGRRLVLEAPWDEFDFGSWPISQRFHDTVYLGRPAPKDKESDVQEEADEEKRALQGEKLFGRDTKFSFEFDAEYLVPRPTIGRLTLVFLGYNRREDEYHPEFYKDVKYRLFGLILRPAVISSDEVAYIRVGHVAVRVTEDGYDHWLEKETREITLV